MKVLHVIASADLRGGGPIEGVRKLIEATHDEGITWELLTLDHVSVPDCHVMPCKVHALGEERPVGSGLINRVRRWAGYSPRAAGWLRDHVRDYDAVLVHGLWNYSTRVARLGLVGSGVPYYVYPHGMLDPWCRRQYPIKHAFKQLLWFINEGPLLRNATALLFTCDLERRLARKTFWPYRVTERVVAFGAPPPPPAAPDDEAAFRRMVPALGDRRYLLFLSRIHEKKGCDLLVQAFAAAAATEPDLDLVIAGPDETGLRVELEALASQLGVAHRIHWSGMVTGGAKYGALRNAEAFVLPSHQENFGIAVAEALSCQCPVLISDQVNIWPEIAEAGAGLVEADTLPGTHALLERWRDTSPAQRQAMGEAALRVFNERFTIRAAADDILALLGEIRQS